MSRLSAAICDARVAGLTLLVLLALSASTRAQEQPASLEIHCDPPDALVVLDRNVLGKAPLRIQPLRPGTHMLRLSAGEDYKPYIHVFTVEPGQSSTLDVKLEPSTRLQLEWGRKAVLEGRLGDALEPLEGAATGLPRQAEALWWIGQVRLVWGDLSESLQAFREYSQYAPDRPDLYLFLGLLHDLGNRPADAVTAYKLALLKTPGLEDSLENLPPSPTWGQVQAAGQPEDARGRLRLAQMLSLKGEMRPALAQLRKAVGQVYGDWRSRVPAAEFPPQQ